MSSLSITNSKANYDAIINYKPEQKITPLITEVVKTSLNQLQTKHTPRYQDGDSLFNKVSRTFVSDINYNLLTGLALGCMSANDRSPVFLFTALFVSTSSLINKRWNKYCNSQISDRLANDLVPVIKDIGTLIKVKTDEALAGKDEQKVLELKNQLSVILLEKITWMREGYLNAGFEWESTKIILDPLVASVKDNLKRFESKATTLATVVSK